MKNIFLFLSIFSFSVVAKTEVVPSKNAKLKSVEWVAGQDVKQQFRTYFEELIGKPWDALKIKIKADQIAKELFSSGYFLSSVKTEYLGTADEVMVRILVKTSERTHFQFSGNQILSHQELKQKLADKIKNDFGKTDRSILEDFIVSFYEEIGVYNTVVSSYQNQGVDLDGVIIKNYFFKVEEGKKLKMKDLTYRGNTAISNLELNNIFKKKASTLALAGYYDKIFFEKYSEIIKKEYLAKGFVAVEVSQPRVIDGDDDGEDDLAIEYGISEKQQVILKAINLDKVDLQVRPIVKKLLINQEESALNVTELENDFKKIISYFQSEGYYFANITNLNSDNLLLYDKTFSQVEINPNIVLDRQICFNQAIITGNIKTKSEVIFREIEMLPGELITPLKLDELRQKLTGLGLFSSLRITPYILYENENEDKNEDKSCAKTNITILVNEKDFGLFEVAPGYRTDLGAKLSTGVTYNNFLGMNRSASLKAQGNQRFSLDGFDKRRKEENKKKLEYLAKVALVEPYLFFNFLKTQLELEMSLSFQRKRFYGFDADIFRISPQLSKNLTKNLSASIKYQFERINQFDATVGKDNDNFSIGGITPSMTYDQRNDPINPSKGYSLNLSSEWANDYFGSMKNNDLEVNYVKVITRNKFYYSVGDVILAFSLALGYEKNFALEVLRDSNGNPLLNSNNVTRTRGYIPSIKVFRLDGYDEIRGFDEYEINRLKTGQAIGDVVVQDEAYFAAFKFEPRYNLTDSLQLGVFFDAGRVFVNEFSPLDLRTSIGAGLKFLTPVGALDFDYGIKLKRQTYSDTRRDSFGRFHLSIGFF